MRISCPPTISPCFYGVDTPRRSELIAATHTLEEIRKYLDADSVAYLSLDGLTGAVRGGKLELLHVVLHRRLSGGVPARRGGVPAAGAEAESGPRRRSIRRRSPSLSSKPIRSPADAVTAVRLRLLPFRSSLRRQRDVRAAAQPPQRLPPRLISSRSSANLSSLDYADPHATPRRLDSPHARSRRRFPLSSTPCAAHPDEFVRNRAFIVLLTAFNDRGTPDLVAGR